MGALAGIHLPSQGDFQTPPRSALLLSSGLKRHTIFDLQACFSNDLSIKYFLILFAQSLKTLLSAM
jgi:hypothetical protein